MRGKRMWALLVVGGVLGLATAGLNPAHGQSTSVGVRGGMNGAYTLFEVEARESREARGSLLVGGIFVHELRPWLAVQAEIQFAQKGWAAAEGEGGIRMSYLEVPILIRLQHAGSLQPHFLIGPTLAFEVGCSFDEMTGTGRVDCDHSLVSLDRPWVDTGVIVGGGIGRAMGPGSLSFDALLNFGLRDVIREPLPWGAQTNLALSLSLAYTVGFGWLRGDDR